MAEVKDILQEYVATANNPQYKSDWNIINSKFPELKGYDAKLLQEYVATANNPQYKSNFQTINSKFPELFSQQQQAIQPKQTTTNGIGVLKSTAQDLGFNSSMFKIPTFNNNQQSVPIAEKKAIGTPTKEQQITGDYLIDNGQKGFVDKSVLGTGTQVVQPETVTEEVNPYLVDVTDKSSDNTQVNEKGITPVSKLSAVNTLSTEELLNTDKEQVRQFLNKDKSQDQLDFENESNSNNNIQKFNGEMSIYDAHIKALNDRSKYYESSLKAKYGEDFFSGISKQNTEIQNEAQQFGLYSTKRKKEYDRLVLELKDIEKQITENQLPREQAEPMYNAKLAQIKAIESDINGKRNDIIKKQDEVNSKIQDADFTTYIDINDKINQLTNEANSTISKPEFAEYRKLLDEGDKAQAKKDAMKKAYQSKGILGKAVDIYAGIGMATNPAAYFLDNGEQVDKTFIGAKVADEGDKLLGRTLKALASVPKMLDISNPIGDANKYDYFDAVFDQAIYASKKRDMLNPTATDVQRDIIQKYADVDGYRVMLDENGNPKNDVRDDKFSNVNDKTKKEITDKYNKNPKAYKTESDFSFSTLITKATPTILDMGTMMATAMLSGGTTGLVAGAGTAGTVSTATTVGVSAAQMYGDMYESGLNAGLTPQEANNFATLTSIMTGMVTLVNPMEANIVKGTASKSIGKFISNSISKADVQLIRSGEMSIGQYAKRMAKEGVKNTFGENLEELVLEPAVQRATETYYNTKAQKNGQQGFEDLNKPFFDTKQTIETAMITTMASLLMTPIEVANSVPEQRKIALQNALDNPQQFVDIRQKMLEGGDIEKGKFDYEVKAFEEISKQYNTVKPNIKEDLHDDLAELLLKKYTLKNTMSQVNDEVLNKKNQLLLDDINKRLEEVADGTYNKGKEKALSNIANPNTLIEEDKIATYNGAEVTILDDLADGEVVINTNNPEIGEDGIITVEKSALTDVRNKPKDIEQVQITSAVININGKEYEGKNHAEAILKAQADGQDISQVDRQAEGLFKLSDGTIINREQAKEQFGQDRSELIIPQDEVSNQANVEYKRIQDEQKNPITPVEPINTGQEVDNGAGIQQVNGNGGEIQQGDGIGQVSVQEVPTEKVEEGVDKKTDIERRRQEEIDNLFSRTQASTDKQLNTPVQKLSKEQVNKNIEIAKQQNKDLIEELENPEFLNDEKRNDEWDKKADELSDKLPQGVSFRITDGKVDFFDNQSYREKGFGKSIVQVSVGNLHNKTEKFEVGDNLQVQDGVRAIPAIVTKVNKHGKILEAKQEDGRIIISRGNIITLAPINDRLKINTKYDAELAAIETPEISKPISEVVEKGEGKSADVMPTNAWGSKESIDNNFYTKNENGFAVKIPLDRVENVNIDGIDFHVSKVDGDWKVIEKNSGLEVSTGKLSNTKKSAIEDATYRISNNGGANNISTISERAIKQFTDSNLKLIEAPISKTETTENPALKDVKSTAEAIKKFKVSELPKWMVDDFVRGYSNGNIRISEAYHKAKADGSNPELVKAVEEALTPTPEVSKPVSEIAKTPISKTETTENPALKDVESTTKALDELPKDNLEFISRKENNRRKSGFYEKAKGVLFKGFGGNASVISDKFGSKYKYFTDNPDYAKSFSLEKEYLTQKGKVEKYQTDYKREYNTNEKHYNEEVLNHSGKKSYIDLTSKDYDNFNDKLKDDGYDVVNIKRTEPLIPSESYRGHSADIRNVEVEEHLILNDNSIKKISDQPILLKNNSKTISEAYHKAKADDSNPELVEAVEQSLKEQPQEGSVGVGGDVDFAKRKKEMQGEYDKLQKERFALAKERDEIIGGGEKYRTWGKKQTDAKINEIRDKQKQIDEKQTALRKELKVIEAKEKGSVELFDHYNSGTGSPNTIIYDIKNNKLLERENVVRGKTKEISIEDAARNKFASTLRGRNEREINEAYTDKVKEKYEAEINDEIAKYKAIKQSLKETTKAETPKVEEGSVGVGGDVGSKSILKSDVDLKGDKKKSWMRKNSLDKISVNDINEEGHNNNLSSAKENVKAGKKSQTKEAPLVEIDENGNATIIDGHHRIAEDILDGKSHIEAVVDNKFNIRDAIKDGLYEKAISEGRMTAKDAKEIIESAGLKIPKAVEDALKPTPEVSKPVSEIAKTPISKTETTEQKLKNDKHDRMVGLMREYNGTPPNRKVRKSELRQKIQKLAMDLGYSVKMGAGDKIDVLNQNGKKIRKLNIVSEESSATPEVIAQMKEIAQSWFEWNGNELDYHIDAAQLGLTWQEIRRAKADLDAGKTESTNINRVANAINEYGNMESLPLVRGFGGNYEYTEVTGKDLEYFNDIDNTKEAPSPYGDDLFQQTDKSFTPISESVFTKLIDKLKMAFPNVKVELFGKNDFENAKKELEANGIKIQDIQTKDGTIYGFKTPDGKVFLNSDNLNANTPIHEYGHIWQSVFPQGFARGIELLKLSPQGRALIAEIQKNPAYKGKSLAEIQAEALVTAIGNKGEQVFNDNPSMLKRFKEWLSDFFKTIGDKLGLGTLSADDKFNKFTKKVVGELLGGKVLSKEVGKSNDVELQSVNNPSKEEIGKAYDVAQQYLETTDFNFDTDQRDAFIEEIKQNPALKAMFTTSQLEKIYEAQPLNAVDKVKIKYKLLVYNLKASNSNNKAGLKQQQKQMVADITALIKGNLGGITGKQAERLTNLATTAVEKNSTVRLGKIINQIANLADQRTYLKAKTLYEVIKARSKRKGGVQSGKLTGVLQDFATINPLDVSDIAKYVELAEKVKQASNVVKQPTDADSDLVYDEVQAYVKAQQDEINSNAINDTLEDDAMTFFTVLDNKTKAKFGDDKTFDDLNEPQQREVFESITKDDIKKYGLTDEERDMVEAFKEIKTEQKRQDFITATYNKIGELKDLLANSVGVITQSPAEKEITDALLNVKLDDMTATEMARVLKLINGITQNNDYSGGGAFVAQQKAVESVAKLNALKSEIGTFRNIKKRLAKIANLSSISESMARGAELGARLKRAIGFSEFTAAVGRARHYAHDLGEQFAKKKFSKSVFKPINQARLTVYASVIQTKIGEEVNEAKHIQNWKEILESNIKNLRKSGNEDNIKEADVLETAISEIIGDANSFADIAMNLSKTNKELLDVHTFFVNAGAEQKPRLRENANLVHNEEIEEYNDYTKLSFTNIITNSKIDVGDSIFSGGATGIVKKKSKSLMDRSNYNNLKDTMKMDLNWINNQFKALASNEYDIQTSKPIETLKAIFNADNEKVREILGTDNFTLLRDRLIRMTNKKIHESTIIDDLMSVLGRSGRTLALGNATPIGMAASALKQSAVLASTIINNIGKNQIPLDFSIFSRDKRKQENILKLLAQSDIISRRASGAGGFYDTGKIENKISDNIAQKGLKILGEGQKAVSDFSMMALRYTDIKAADISWITYYKNYLRKKGLPFDDNNEFKNPNKDAMAYAETMVERSQGANTDVSQADMWEYSKGLSSIFMPFMAFAVQANVRMFNNYHNIYNGKNRGEALKDIAAFNAEIALFNVVKLGISASIVNGLIPLLKSAIIGGDDDDEVEKARKAKQLREGFWQQLAQDHYGIMPLFDDNVTKPIANKLWKNRTGSDVPLIPLYNGDKSMKDGMQLGLFQGAINKYYDISKDLDIMYNNPVFGGFDGMEKEVTEYEYKGNTYKIVHSGGYVSKDMYISNRQEGRFKNIEVPLDVLVDFVNNPSEFKKVKTLAWESASVDKKFKLELDDNQKAFAAFIFAVDVLSILGASDNMLNRTNNTMRKELAKKTIKQNVYE